jgi:transposase
MLTTLFTHCAGIDVHKRMVMACRIRASADGTLETTVRSFGTTTAELLRLSDWLTVGGVTHVAMESTGVYWKPVFNVLDGSFTVWVLNAQHVKNVPGRKTDVNDAQWLAELLRHGLVQPSFIPPQEQRDLRELTRERTNFVRQRATLINRVQKVLESANLKLGDVATNVLGVSGRAMLDAIVAGETDAAVLADLAVGKLRKKRAALEQALVGRVRPHHRVLLTELLCQIDSLDETLLRLDEAVAAACVDAEKAEAIALLDTIPGVGPDLAEVVVAEIGTDLSRFPSAGHLAAWAGLAPGNNESAGKRRTGRTRKGNPHLQVGLVQAARAAVRTKGTYLAAQYRRLVQRIGDHRALVAVAHSIVVSIYHILTRKEPYHDLGADYFERRQPEAQVKRLTRQIEKLGYTVTVTPPAAAA